MDVTHYRQRQQQSDTVGVFKKTLYFTVNQSNVIHTFMRGLSLCLTYKYKCDVDYYQFHCNECAFWSINNLVPYHLHDMSLATLL